MRTTSRATLSVLGGLVLAAAATGQELGTACASGSTKVSDSGRSYCDLGRSFTLDACARECQALGASLPCPDAAENDFVASLRQGDNNNDRIWLGLYQAANASRSAGWDSWAGASCSASYRKWARSEPNDFGCLNENVAVIAATKKSSEWIDIPASARASCICESGDVLAEGFIDDVIPELTRAAREGIEDCVFDAEWLEYLEEFGLQNGKNATVLTLSLILGFSVLLNVTLICVMCCCALCKANKSKTAGCCNGANGITIIHHNPLDPNQRQSAADANLQYVRNIFNVPAASGTDYSIRAANIPVAAEVPSAPVAETLDVSDQQKGMFKAAGGSGSPNKLYPEAWLASAHEGNV